MNIENRTLKMIFFQKSFLSDGDFDKNAYFCKHNN